MAKARRQDSNATGLAFAVEGDEIGILADDAEWNPLLPNSYSDFGGELVTIVPQPITPRRRRQKGEVTDLNASGGFNHDLNTSTQFRTLLEAMLFGTVADQAAAVGADGFADGVAGDIEWEQASLSYTSTALDFTTLGIIPGQFIFVGGDANVNIFDDPTLNGFKRIRSVTARALVIDKSVNTPGADNDGAGKQIRIYVGQALKDENTRKSFHLRRTLGLSNPSNHTREQWELLKGSIPSEFAMNIGTAGLVNCDFSFISTDHQQAPSSPNGGIRTPREVDNDGEVTGFAVADRVLGDEILVGTAFNPSEDFYGPDGEMAVAGDLTVGDIYQWQRHATLGNRWVKGARVGDRAQDNVRTFNTSSDFSRIKMSMAVLGDANVDPLFAFITEMTLNINNNITPSKAVGVLGAFDVSAGIFTLSGTLTAYFADVAAVQAVRDSADVTLDFALVKNNRGLVVDIPLISLGNGRLNVELNAPVTLPLSLDAAEAEELAVPGSDRTAVFTFFNALPNAADTSL